jgi:N-acylneuraminate cytidylyltransferase
VSKTEILAVIPARGQSKTIPRKNLRLFAGHPLLAFSIAAGLQASSVTRVIVSTDDDEIARTARSYGAEIPFLRPSALAQDDTPDLPVFQHLIAELLRRENYRPTLVVHLRPTSPLRPPDLVDRAIATMQQPPIPDSVRGVVPTTQNPYKMWRLGSTGELVALLNDIHEGYNLPRQSLPDPYWQTGHIDVIRFETLMEQHSMSGRAIRGHRIDPRYSVDIDTEEDWVSAEHAAATGALEIVSPGGPARS